MIASGTLKLQSGLPQLPNVTGNGITLQRWYDAQVAGSVLAPGGGAAASGGTVATWSDLSGNANASNSASAGGVGAPLYVTGGSNSINGHPAVWFGNGGNSLGFSMAGLANGSNASTMFVVGQLTGNSGNWGWMAAYGGSGADNARSIGHNGANVLDFSVWGADTSSTSGPTLSYASPSPVLAACVFGGTGNSVQGSYQYGGSSGTASLNATLTTGTAGGHIGQRVDTGGGEYWYGSVGEVLIYNGALSASQQQQVTSYLASEWLGSGTPTAPGSLPAGSPVQIATAGAVLDLGSGTQQVASLADYPAPGSSSGTVLNSSTAASILTLSATGGSTTFSGAIAGGGTLGTISLLVSGSGTQVLAGANTYTGATTISGGSLLLGSGGSLGPTPVSVSASGTFGTALAASGGTASLGGTLNLNPGSTLNLADGFTNVLRATAGTLAGATLRFDLSGAASDELLLGGAASVSGLNMIGITAFGSSLTAGNYTLISAASGLAAGDFTLSANTISIAGARYGLSLANSTTAAEILTVGPYQPPPSVWAAAVSGSWSTGNWIGGVPNAAARGP